ncbi:hypothetical protein GCM10027347_55440 [Larkinella harenae]
MNNESIFTQFQELYKNNNLPDCDHQFVKDGIIDPVLYENQPIKILFIAKEHNYQKGHDYVNNHADYRKWMQSVMLFQFAHRLGEWAYGIQNDFPDCIDQVSNEDKHRALKSVAFINVKKASGTAIANWRHIHQYITESRSLLHQQINQINPTLIIGCFRYKSYLESLLGMPLKESASKSYSIGHWNGIDVINFWHPSSRKSKRFLYDQLKEAVAA